MQECKIFFNANTTREQAQSIINRYDKTIIDTYQENREIGCNTVTFAVITLPIKIVKKLIDDLNVKNIEVITSFKGSNSCAEECSGGG